ncbi:MAG TPA: T9SS type A sorting domain-containing protein [Flavobacteriales bacterium]|jgi:uncharacterized repeat protein (TIGR01451 family)|nr:T9SS type A sorting domain-containing protein [Flavobacteriales bacterium]MBK7111712.1 T9SS type A sorting domain-containing protein [Flavobacteriales bacterium]MBK7483926.1 T9SS type A sorting domain-containing protein [Flavobacteriales bacterium]MBK8709474.1 T9SS type A sorting domain-containing protein [Flavobacteriales bacterium]HQW05727.1 T9SS type A sorting domain-containing protein [Flavobacteriales bacterium]
MIHLQRLVLSSFLLLTCSVGQAQVFIPDQIERLMLNELIPGIVDAGGVMDTLHPGIMDLDTAFFSFPAMPATVDLRGIQYLDSLKRLMFTTNPFVQTFTAPTVVTVEGLPTSLRDLIVELTNYEGLDLHLPQLPAEMDRLSLRADGFAPSLFTIERFPDHIGRLELFDMDSVFWPGTGHADMAEVSWSGLDSPIECHLPAFTTDELTSHGTTFLLDLGQVSTPILNMSYRQTQGPIIWPMQLESLNLNFCSLLGSLSAFPESLTWISMMDSYVACLPILPEGFSGIWLLTSLPPCLPNWPESMDPFYYNSELITEANATYCSVLNSTCPGSYPGISGRVFIDTDGDGEYDLGEPGLQQASVTVQPNGNMVGCDSDGGWEIGVAPGSYSITAGSNYPYLQSITPTTHSADALELGDADTDNHFAVTLIPNISDLRVSLYADRARPGFDNQVYLRCENYGTIPMDAELTLAFDADQTWLSSSVAPNATSGNTATWNFSAMPAGTVQHIVVDLHTAASVPLGTEITHTAIAEPTTADETPLDNTSTYIDIVVGSYDPNDKLLSPAKLSPEVVAVGETPIEYTIRFQNTGTYLAERVVILDTLSEDLQWASMRFLDSSHPNHWYVTDGVLHVIHSDINLPDSTSDEAGSHGFVRFSMLPNTNLTNGSVIENIAHIVFDFNAPIITPPAVFSVDVLASVAEEAGNAFRIYPNPVHDRLWITLPETHEPVINYTITDLLGKVQASGASTNRSVDVQALASGMYTLMIDHAGVREGVRFVKE